MEIPDKWIDGLFRKLDKFEKEYDKNKCATWQERLAFSSLAGHIESLEK